ncbi:hypothetical protein [Winogradskyella ursingii]|uniref:hypothetical protein n=1 Tax=Winogradskyella ursingii TaxID=2686079 RepID=UPI0015CBA49F|nr:hypothetical protein [Winogradskyella ursingii]
MVTVIIAVVGIILLTILIVWLIDKFVPKKVKPIIHILLWGLIIYLGYITFMSVYREIQFNQLKDKRYAVVIERLKDIRDTQLLYKDVNNKYADSFEKLIRFVDTAQVPITQRRDTLVLDVERTRAFGGVETMKTETLIDTLSFFSVKDSLFKGKDTYKNMMNVGVGKEGATFELKAGTLDDIPVFEASVDKAVVLYDQEKYLIDKEKQKQSIAGVKGPTIRVGSMEEISTNGNWGKDLSNEQ